MSYTKDLLQQTYSLSVEDVDATLSACNLPLEQAEYSDEEIQSRFDVIRQLISQGKTYKQAASYFQRQEKKRVQATEFPPMNILELLAHIASEYGIQLDLTEAIKIMSACGLSPNQKEFRQLECERFVEACDLIKEQGQSFEKVANHFGITQTNGHLPAQHLAENITNITIASETGIVHLVDKITEKRAEQIPGLVNQMYLKNVVNQLASSQDEIINFYAGLEERILEEIEGKSPIKNILQGQWPTIPLAPSSSMPMLSLNESENDSTTS